MWRQLLVLPLVLLLTACAGFGGRPAPVYGCWCGKNQPPPGEDPAPVDAWDLACKRHDKCYGRYGRDHPECDAYFVREIQELAFAYGYVPAQMQAAHSYFLSRLYGTFYIQGWFTPRDLVTLAEAGDAELCNN